VIGATASAAETGVWRGVARAKVNLYLHVVGRRADGYHLLDSLVGFTLFGDILVLRRAARPALRTTGPLGASVARGEENLAMVALRAMARACGRPPDISIALAKRIPIEAGLGGGSADAAAVLRGLAALWGLAADDPRPKAVARSLGADLPVCLASGTSFVGGIGDALEPGPTLTGRAVVLANPRVPLATRDVFARRDGPFGTAARFADAGRDAAALAALLADRRNDLTEPALALAPAIGGTIDCLEQQPGCRLVRMSGSGASVFGLFDSVAAALRAAAVLRRAGLWAVATRFA
jgi:4-diphosphocytidyl-2-C-methyl-D-erythritol kinase